MVSEKKHVLYVVDKAGHIQAVQLSPELWAQVESTVLAKAKLLEAPQSPADRPEAMGDFKEFMNSWDFRYPYDPAVTCPHCKTHSDNWQQDAEHPFHLTNANLGGLLVFYCKHCGGTVRVKHFRDHVATEYTGRN